MATPVFAVGDHVVRGQTGRAIYRVTAVITTGRIVTYDLTSVNAKRTFVGVPQHNLYRSLL